MVMVDSELYPFAIKVTILCWREILNEILGLGINVSLFPGFKVSVLGEFIFYVRIIL